MTDKIKPLNGKAYGSIAHLPGSRMFDKKDKGLHIGQVKLLTEKTRDKHDIVIVQEKLDGSCVAIVRLNGQILPITRAGYLAKDSPHKQHHMFHDWVMSRELLFKHLLKDNERIVGEWLAMAHGIKYAVYYPFVAFDLMVGTERVSFRELEERLKGFLCLPYTHSYGLLPVSLGMAREYSAKSRHGGESCEGVVYRMERKGKVDFLGKFVNNTHICGKYFNEDESKLIYNWRP